MELLSPFSFALPLASFRRGFYRTTVHMEMKTSRRSPEGLEANNNKVYVAVGKSFEKAVVLLQWACRTFGNSQICILHVHQPSPWIPTPVGRLPASKANAEVVSAFRNEEREVMRKRLYNYLNVCCQFKVKMSIITTEAGEVQKGIVDLVKEHNIRKLVFGAIPDSTKAKKSSRKASYVARNAPMFSEILFVYKGKLVFIRKSCQFPKSAAAQSQLSCNNEAVFIPKSPGSSSVMHIPSAGIENLTRVQRVPTDGVLSLRVPNSISICNLQTSTGAISNNASSSTSVAFASVGQKASLNLETNNNRYEGVATKLKLLQASTSTLKQGKQQQKDDGWANHRGKSHGRGEGAIVFTKDSSELVEFSYSDLQIATCNFSESFKIGESGYGTVYKGELLDRTVVIKKLHTHNLQSHSEFLQQVEVLGKLHHNHLVTLLGICPESWSLICEYLPGGNLHDRLFPRINIGRLSWKIRTKIVADIAKGLLFLHSSSPEKIVHGNLKPENILIGPDNTCKICDFGIYRLLQPQTLRCPSFSRLSEPKGVFSYTDPEFLETGNLTPKSDIYSFGLIILQILTRRALPGLSNEVRRALVSGNLESVLDSSAGEWPAFVARKLAELGIDCCELYSRYRPELTPSIVNELEGLQCLDERAVPSIFLCPISQEIMYDPRIAADGFTYEAEAIREWLGSGHHTSPLTNLKLRHLELTPNDSLRFAIQDWLCKSE
nr:U-box domain-containing protein 33-like [Ipomoea batatas]